MNDELEAKIEELEPGDYVELVATTGTVSGEVVSKESGMTDLEIDPNDGLHLNHTVVSGTVWSTRWGEGDTAEVEEENLGQLQKINDIS